MEGWVLATEEDAKTKVCWKTMGEHARENCIGSACMAWEPGEVVSQFGVYGNRLPDKRLGYCGIVGEPE